MSDELPQTAGAALRGCLGSLGFVLLLLGGEMIVERSSERIELGIVLINHGDRPFIVTRGMRIAQLVISRVERAQWIEVAELPETGRGQGGYGHTGHGA